MKRAFRFVVALSACFFFSMSATAHEFKRAVTLEDARGATCRVCVPGARGTGFFFGVEGEYGLIGTNYHVVQKNKSGRLDFWTNGYMESVNATIDWRAYNLALIYDFAIMRVPVDELAKINPCWIALAGADAKPNVGAIIISCGAPDGRFPQAWKGQLTEYYNGKTAVFSPPPVPGQSGSPICEYVNGELFVTGILTWLFGEKGNDDSKGGAIPIANLYKALGIRGADVEYHDDNASPIPPDATECAESTSASAPCILMFTQANCPPCVDAERDVEFLRALGVPVYVYDVATAVGSEYVKRYGVERTPTFVLLDKEYRPVVIRVGAGKGDELREEYEKHVEKLRAELNNIKAELSGDGARDGKVLTGQTLPSDRAVPPSPDSSAIINLPEAAPLDFRQRAPVCESARNVGIFDDADARWQELKRKRNNGEQPKDDDQSTKEDKTRPKLKERLQDGTSEIINQAVNKTIEKLKAQMKEKWEAVKFTVFMTFCFILALALLIASAIAHGVNALLRWALGAIARRLNDDEG